ncbi:MAG: hypothetical protein A2X11_11195 [Bacteroidetes bacterium GWE2_42_24]|nr:MAG: hypothetical protein A2X11_11195 [Bacteroidetes bacterium GWE2_42_24]OFY25551.1 MAG: hypothetical protein A2X09_17525 [Bacteroidetes bacterium GWF2_43_11]
MKKLSILFCSTILTLYCIGLQAQDVDIKPWKYNINIELKDSALWVNLSLKITKAQKGQNDFLLFNRYIQIKKAILDDRPFEYTRSNDTLFFEAFQQSEMTLLMQYEIPCSMFEYSKTVASYGDSIYAYPVLFDAGQIFCERFNKWYPVLYDNFSDYCITISVPKTHKVFGYYPKTDCINSAGNDIYSFNCFDEDFPFFITQTNIFQQHKIIQHNTTNYEFYFLPRNRRLLDIVDRKPVYVSDVKQIDSLLSVIINRSMAAVDWYNANLWQQRIETLRFVETSILGLGACLESFILLDRSLMNMEVIDRYAVSHEISHIWLGIHTEYLAKGKFFLGETIPEYVNLLYYESWAGDDAFENAIQDKINLKLSEVPFYTVAFEQVLNQRKGSFQADDIIYHKGVAFVHEFRKLIGKEKLLKIIRETYSVPNHFVNLRDFEMNIKANGCWNEYLKLFEIKL